MPAMFAIASYPIAAAPTVVVTSPSSPLPITVGLSCYHGGTTAGDLIRRALHHVLVEASESTLAPDEYSDGLDALNGYMNDLQANGVRLGWTDVCNISDVVTVPDGALRAIAANLAIDLAPQYGGRVTPALIQQASEGLKTLYRLGVKIGETRKPVTLPVGSGNWYVDVENFYQESSFGHVTIAGNRRTTDLDVVAEAQKAQGVWSVQTFSGMLPDISGRITNQSIARTFDIYAEFNLTAENSTTGGVIAILKNNAIALYTENLSLSSDPLATSITGRLAMETGDFIEVFLADTTRANTFTLIDSVVSVT